MLLTYVNDFLTLGEADGKKLFMIGLRTHCETTTKAVNAKCDFLGIQMTAQERKQFLFHQRNHLRFLCD